MAYNRRYNPDALPACVRPSSSLSTTANPSPASPNPNDPIVRKPTPLHPPIAPTQIAMQRNLHQLLLLMSKRSAMTTLPADLRRPPRLVTKAPRRGHPQAPTMPGGTIARLPVAAAGVAGAMAVEEEGGLEAGTTATRTADTAAATIDTAPETTDTAHRRLRTMHVVDQGLRAQYVRRETPTIGMRCGPCSAPSTANRRAS